MEEEEYYIVTLRPRVRPPGDAVDPYYFTGNYGDGYPPMWTWRRSLGLKVVRGQVAQSFADHISKTQQIQAYIMRVPK